MGVVKRSRAHSLASFFCLPARANEVRAFRPRPHDSRHELQARSLEMWGDDPVRAYDLGPRVGCVVRRAREKEARTDPMARKNEKVAALLSMYWDSVATKPRGPAPPLCTQSNFRRRELVGGGRTS